MAERKITTPSQAFLPSGASTVGEVTSYSQVFDAVNTNRLVGETLGLEKKLATSLIVEGKGLDINRTSIALKALGETAFLMDSNNDGVITKGEALEAGIRLRESLPQARNILTGDALNSLAASIPAQGLTKGQLVEKLHSAESAMMAADKNHDGYLDGSEIKVPITKDLAQKYHDGVEKLQDIDLFALSKASTPEIARDVKKNLSKIPKNISELDTDKDGSLSLTEIRNAIKDKFGKEGEAALKATGVLNSIPDGASSKGAPLNGNQTINDTMGPIR